VRAESRLTLVRRIPGTRPVRAIFACSCGTEKEFLADAVKRGRSRSCGCLNRELAKQRMKDNAAAFSGGNERHGLFHTGAHRSWSAMIQRCTNPNRENYRYYGGRGISICSGWLTFEGFFADMGYRPEGKTLERINNDGDYGPGNCIWADMKAQSNNRRRRGSVSATG
jgi:hypothetical protein